MMAAGATDPAQLGGDMPTGQIVSTFLVRPGHDLDHVKEGYDAPFPDSSYKPAHAAFRFCCRSRSRRLAKPTPRPRRKRDCASVPFQSTLFLALLSAESGRTWAATLKNATFDAIEGAGHFVPEEAGEEVVAILLDRLGREKA